MAATIQLDDNGGGDGWFFDQTPLDDAEFTAIVNSGATGTGTAFQGSFVDVATAGLNYNDFYRTITHEIGHALGIRLTDPLGLNSGNWLIQNQITTQTYTLAVNTTDNSLGPLTYVGRDQVAPTRTQVLFDPNTGRNDPFTVVNELWQYPLAGGGFVTFTEDGGGHFYEGPRDPAFPAAAIQPNDLMNAGRTVPPPGGNPIPTTRQFVSDLDVQMLTSAYHYIASLPSTLDTAHATLDSLTGTLLVQGRTGALNDTITIDMVGSNIRVQVNAGTVNAATELIPAADVNKIVVAGNGGTDTITVTGVTLPVQQVDFVVSSNQDNATAGMVSGVLDLDTNTPGNQVALRSAIRNTNMFTSARSIYVPRGSYRLTLSGSSGDGQGDLDIMRNTTIIGSGAGSTIIDAGGFGATPDRVFDVAMNDTLNLSDVTLTGGRSPNAMLENGGAIVVRDGGA